MAILLFQVQPQQETCFFHLRQQKKT